MARKLPEVGTTDAGILGINKRYPSCFYVGKVVLIFFIFVVIDERSHERA